MSGAHADVGGGYVASECGLSDCGLAWMTERLAPLGVSFAAQPAYPAKPDPTATAHQPWTRGRYGRRCQWREFPPTVF